MMSIPEDGKDRFSGRYFFFSILFLQNFLISPSFSYLNTENASKKNARVFKQLKKKVVTTGAFLRYWPFHPYLVIFE